MKHTTIKTLFENVLLRYKLGKRTIEESTKEITTIVFYTTRGIKEAKAAPDMLKALIIAREFMLKSGLDYNNAGCYNIIDKAIKKATE